MFVLAKARCTTLGRGDDTVGNPHRTQMSQFELFELTLLLKLDEQLPVEQFEPTVSQSTVPFPSSYTHAFPRMPPGSLRVTRSAGLFGALGSFCRPFRPTLRWRGRPKTRYGRSKSVADCNHCNCSHNLPRQLYDL